MLSYLNYVAPSLVYPIIKKSVFAQEQLEQNWIKSKSIIRQETEK